MFDSISALSCAFPGPDDPKDDVSPLSYLGFLFLSPCPQRLLFSAADLIFISLLLLFSAHKILSRLFLVRRGPDQDLNPDPLLPKPAARICTSFRFPLALALSALLAASYAVLLVLAILDASGSTGYEIAEFLFLALQLLANSSAAALVAHERRFAASSHPLSLRLYWSAAFALASLLFASSVLRLTAGDRISADDVVALASFPFSFVLFYVAVTGSTGVSVVTDAEPDRPARSEEDEVTPYASASILSLATWSWMNPLLTKGRRSPLRLDDIPHLAPQHRAERMLALFERCWPAGATKSDRPVQTTMLRCFWPYLLLTGLLSLLKLAVMYVGPSLVSNFVDFASSADRNLVEGYRLCAMLLASKLFEVLASHHYNFIAGNFGMMIRSSLITALYKKGLKLSCTSRQLHGLGKIVNYMAVDAQQVADVMLQLHYLWLMPTQVAVALGLLYLYMGVAITAGIVGLLLTMAMVWLLTKKSNNYQFLLMGMRDKRMKAVNEMLSYMRVIKFQAWEEHFNKRINKFREGEYVWLSRFLYILSTNMTTLSSIDTVIAALVFGMSVLFGRSLSASAVFTAMSFFRLLGEPLRTFPQALISITQALISLERLDSYMTSAELDEDAVERVEGCGDGIAIEVRNGEFAWGDEDEGAKVELRGLDFEVQRGSLAAVVGTVGSGKSSLISCLIGEMRKVSGKVRVCGTTAYVAQTAWIQNGTIQDNILFGEPMDREKYKQSIKVCCLEKDLEMMEFGDQTEIGERGINLSGGQKQRIQLARAVYQDCDIYLLDDVFSAVDAHTGSELFKECVRGALKTKTVVLVTHQVDFLHNADLILVMRDGEIVQSGKYDDVLVPGSAFETLVAAHDSSMELVAHSSPDQESNTSDKPVLKRNTSDKPVLKRELSNIENGLVVSPKPEKHAAKLIEDEERETGLVSWNVYKLYITEAWGWSGVVVVIVISILAQGCSMASDYWLAYETSYKNVASFHPNIFIEVYSLIAIVSIIFLGVRSYIVTHMGLVTARIFFKQILNSILHAPMSFFDTTPSGRILSRVSSDQTNLDLFLPFFMGMTITSYCAVIATVFVTCQVALPTLIFVIPLGWLNFWYRGYYLSTSRELTRLDSITKAPVIHHFSETILGVTTIRCFRKEQSFSQENLNRVNSSFRMDFHNKASTEWLGFRLELIGSFILCLSTLLMVMLPSNLVNPEFVGLSLSYGLSLNAVLFWTVWMSCFLENRMVSVERIKQFTNIPSEAAWEIRESVPSPRWPTEGNIDIWDLRVRYRENTPLVLTGITLSIKGGEKIGVVGRTGSGKSTFIQALFRIVEPYRGKIVIDGIDISTLGLHDLRSRFGIIPQEPVLFEGTVRSNMDPTGQYTDDEIWQSLERCQLKDVVTAKPEKLDALVVDSGDNWSVGQRQLLCLGRVMLKRSKILFMDEATASVDSQTDGVIQKIIREDFASCTIISIAHRIPTVMDCDRVLVIDAGKAKEFDSPSNLINRPSLFGALVQEYANRSAEL